MTFTYEIKFLFLLGCLLVAVSLFLRRTFAGSFQEQSREVIPLARHGQDSMGLDAIAKLSNQ